MQWAHPGPGGGRQTVPITRISWAARKHLYCWPHSEWVTACCSSEEVYYLSRISPPPLHPNNYLVLIPGLEHFNLVIPKCWIIKRVECVSEQQALQGGNRCYLSVLTKHLIIATHSGAAVSLPFQTLPFSYFLFARRCLTSNATEWTVRKENVQFSIFIQGLFFKFLFIKNK